MLAVYTFRNEDMKAKNFCMEGIQLGCVHNAPYTTLADCQTYVNGTIDVPTLQKD